MTKGSLKLKRTPAEQAEHAARRAARKAAKRARYHEHRGDQRQPSLEPLHPRSGTEEYGPSPPPSSGRYKVDYDEIQAQIEEERFREKLWDAFGDDERLDAVEARLNDHAHVPRRWRSGGMDRMEDDYAIDPNQMEDEDYAEWIRIGMWRKKHADEYAEQVRQQAAHKARLEQEKMLREETKRLEKEAEDERRRRRRERHEKHWKQARERYEEQWKILLAAPTVESKELQFEDIPWPVFIVDIGPSTDKKGKRRATEPVIDLDDINAENVSRFLLSTSRSDDQGMAPIDDAAKKERRDKLRETMLRFHPDKFEGRILPLVRKGDQQKVKEGVSKVAIALNTLMGAK